MLLQDKVAVVIGAAGGIGRSIALGYARAGAKVVCADLRELPSPAGFEDDMGVATHQVIVRNGGQAVYVPCDVTQTEQVKGVVAAAVAEFDRLDILVNSAGVFTGLGGIETKTDDDWERTMAVNAKGVWNGAQAAITQFLAQGTGGKVVNIASVGGVVGLPMEPDYCASKGAVVNLTRQLGIDYASRGINVNAICPGAFRTAMAREAWEIPQVREATTAAHPIGRWGDIEEIAGPAIFLASDLASFVCGQILAVDGGATAA